MKSIPIHTGLPIPATLLFNREIRTMLAEINREPINFNADNEHYEALKTYQQKYTNGNDNCEDSFSFPIGSTVAVQCKDDIPWTHGIVQQTNGNDH